MTERTLSFHTAAGPHILAGEPFAAGWRRVADQLVAATVAELSPDIDDVDEGVHAARKNVKRMRAMVRLVRPALDRADARAANVALRDVGRSLSPARDAWVMIETLSGLYDRYDDLIADGAFAAAERLFSARYRTAMANRREDAARAAEALRAAGDLMRRLGPLPDDFPAVAAGMGGMYRASRRAMRRAAATADPVAFHDWRKRVKDLRYQLELLHPIQPVLTGAMVLELDRLGHLLGLDHDLVVLAETVRSDPACGRSDRERWLILALAHEWRAELHATALPLGAALLTERPSAFVARIGGYWAAGRSS